MRIGWTYQEGYGDGYGDDEAEPYGGVVVNGMAIGGGFGG